MCVGNMRFQKHSSFGAQAKDLGKSKILAIHGRVVDREICNREKKFPENFERYVIMYLERKIEKRNRNSIYTVRTRPNKQALEQSFQSEGIGEKRAVSAHKCTVNQRSVPADDRCCTAIV